MCINLKEDSMAFILGSQMLPLFQLSVPSFWYLCIKILIMYHRAQLSPLTSLSLMKKCKSYRFQRCYVGSARVPPFQLQPKRLLISIQLLSGSYGGNPICYVVYFRVKTINPMPELPLIPDTNLTTSHASKISKTNCYMSHGSEVYF